MLKNKTALSLSPLALLTLAACGGTTSSSSSSKGAVQNGPLEGAFAFLDLHTGINFQGDGLYDINTEQGMATQGAGGAFGAGGYSLAEPASGTYTLIATTSAATIDVDTNTAYGAGITLKAPEGASVITPQTTMIEAIVAATGVAPTAAAISSASTTVATAMGIVLPAGETLASFDAYAAGVDPALKFSVQKANNNVMTVVKTMAAASEGMGVGAAAASNMAFTGMLEQVKVAGGTLDFTDNTTLSAITAKVEAAFLTYSATPEAALLNGGTGINTVYFNTVATAAQLEIKEVADQIALLLVTDTDEAKAAVFKVIATLADTVETFSTAVKDDAGVVTNALTFDTIGQMANTAPTDILLSGSTTTGAYTTVSDESVTFLETAASLVVGTLTGVDNSVNGGVTLDAAGALTFTVVGGADMASFEITGGNQLTFKTQPDYESGKTSYSVTVNAKDASGASKVETFTVNITDDTTEGGAFGISSDAVVWTDYQPATVSGLGAVVAGKDITNTVMSSTNGSAVTLGSASFGQQLNLANLTNFTDSSFVGTAKSPVLKFTLDSVPTGSGTATVTATITDGGDATRTLTEDQISITVSVAYMGDGTTATLSVPAGTATGTYNKGDGTSVAFSLDNVGVDAFSITAANAVTGLPASLDLKLGTLYEAFESGAGNSNMLQEGTYNIAIETTLPLQNAANETVTTFGTAVTLVSGMSNDTLLGTDGADTLAGGNTGQIVFAGMGGYDTISLGSGTDYVVLLTGSGGSTSAYASNLTGFSNGTDKFFLGEIGTIPKLTFADLTIAQGTTSADTLISVTATSTTAEEFLMHVTGVANNLIDTFDFVGDVA